MNAQNIEDLNKIKFTMISNSLTDIQRDCLYACTIAKGHNITKGVLPKGSFYRHCFGEYTYADASCDIFSIFVSDKRVIIAFRGTDFSDDQRFLGKQIFTKEELATLDTDQRIIRLQEELKYGIKCGRYSDCFTDERTSKGHNISPLHGLSYQMISPILRDLRDKSVILTGASMGGNLAIYVARIFAASNGLELPVVAFTPAFGDNHESWRYLRCLAFREICDPISFFATKHVQTISFVLKGSDCKSSNLQFHDIQNYMSGEEYKNLTGNFALNSDEVKTVVQIIS